MPTYDYECDACGHSFELFQSITEESKKTCPHCGKRKLRRLIGPGAAILFKGSGFYTTDYRSQEYNNRTKAEGGKPVGSGDEKGKSPETSKDSASETPTDS